MFYYYRQTNHPIDTAERPTYRGVHVLVEKIQFVKDIIRLCQYWMSNFIMIFSIQLRIHKPTPELTSLSLGIIIIDFVCHIWHMNHFRSSTAGGQQQRSSGAEKSASAATRRKSIREKYATIAQSHQTTDAKRRGSQKRPQSRTQVRSMVMMRVVNG